MDITDGISNYHLKKFLKKKKNKKNAKNNFFVILFQIEKKMYLRKHLIKIPCRCLSSDSRINPFIKSKLMSAEDIAEKFPEQVTIGASGFTLSGYPKVKILRNFPLIYLLVHQLVMNSMEF